MNGKRACAVAIATVVLVLGVSTTAGARGGGSIPTSIVFDSAQDTANPNVLRFIGVVTSPKPKCEKHRQLRFAARPFPSNAPFSPRGSAETNGDGEWSKLLNVQGLPEFRIKAPAKRVGRPGHRRKCAADTIFLEP